MSKKKQPASLPKPPGSQQPNNIQPTETPATPVIQPDTWKNILKFSLIGIFVIMTIMSFWYGISGDEIDMNAYGKSILHYFTSFGADKTALDPPKDFDRDGVLEFYGGFFDLLAAIINKISPLSEYATRHILNAWAGFLAIFFSVKICTRIAGSRIAVICAWLMFLAPFFLGHAMNNPKDIPFAAAYIAAIYFFMRFYDKLPQVKWKDYIAPVLSLAIAIDIRVAGILLIPYMIVYFMIKFLFGKEAKKPAGKAIGAIAIISVAGYLLSTLFWPYALQDPLSNPMNALSELSNFQVTLKQLYDGQRIFSTELPASFLPWSFIITTPYVLLAGLLLFIAALWYARKRPSFSAMSFIAFVTIFPLVYIIYKHSNVYHAWRHVLFIFPGAAIMAACGWDWLIGTAKKPAMRYAAAGLLCVGFAEPLVFTATTFPNTITYYNAFAGGVKNAYYNYEMDYYYNSLKPATDWFIKNELPKQKDTVIIASNAAHIVGEYFKAYPKVKVEYVRFYERSNSKWDYAIFHRALIPDNMLRSKGWVIKGTLHTEDAAGLPLCIVAKRPSGKDYEGFAALQQGNTEKAVASLLEYCKADNANELVNSLLAKYYMSVNQPAVAEKYVEQALATAPDDAETSVIKGQILVAKGQTNEAIQLFDNLVNEYPDAMQLHFYKGQALQAAGRLDQALTEYNMAANVPEMKDVSYKAMSQILMQQGKTEEAQRLYR